jgi:hypothetical protein
VIHRPGRPALHLLIPFASRPRSQYVTDAATQQETKHLPTNSLDRPDRCFPGSLCLAVVVRPPGSRVCLPRAAQWSLSGAVVVGRSWEAVSGLRDGRRDGHVRGTGSGAGARRLPNDTTVSVRRRHLGNRRRPTARCWVPTCSVLIRRRIWAGTMFGPDGASGPVGLEACCCTVTAFVHTFGR